MPKWGARVGVKPWQLQQAANAARIYRYQYRKASKDEGSDGKKSPLPDEAAMLGRLREVIRLRHYAKSTERTYLHWTRRFLAYRRRAGGEDEPTSDDVRAFLTRLAMADTVSSSTQNQAFSAILLFFWEVLRTDLETTVT